MPKQAKSIMSLAMVAVAGTVYAGAALAQTQVQPPAQAPAQAPMQTSAPTIDVTNQKLTRNTVTINDVNMPTRGFVVVHASDAKGMMTSRILGFAALREGDHKSVMVHLRGTHQAGETLWVVAHQTKGHAVGVRRRGNIGEPFMQNGQPVDKSFQTL